MKKMIAMVLALMLVFSMAACASSEGGANDGGANDGKYTIGICQFVQHPALDQATQGFKDAVTKELGADKVYFLDKNASGEETNCTSIMSDFISSKVDLIMANATPAVAAAYNATETIPILGTSVTEYGVALGIKDFSGTVGANVSGTSDLADLDKQAQMVIDWCPDAKKAGLLFCSKEANSQYQVDKVQAYLEGKGLECKQFPFSDASNMNAVTQAAAAWADAIYVPTDNTVATYATAINDICQPAGVPIIAGEAGICSGCGIATMSIDYYELGYTTGMMAVRILRDGEDITKMPIEYAPNVTLKYNEEICKALNITPLEGYVKLEG